MQSMSLPSEEFHLMEIWDNARCPLRRDSDNDDLEGSEVTFKAPPPLRTYLILSSAFAPSTGGPRSLRLVRFLDNESG